MAIGGSSTVRRRNQMKKYATKYNKYCEKVHFPCLFAVILAPALLKKIIKSRSQPRKDSMVGGHTRNKASKKTRVGFEQNFKQLTTVPKKDSRTTIMKRGSRIRKASRKKLLSSDRHQTQVATRNQDGEAISRVSVQTESVSETTLEYKNAESKEAQEMIRMLKKKLWKKTRK